MRALQIVDWLSEIGGMERFVQDLTATLLREGHETHLMAKHLPSSQWGEFRNTSLLGDTRESWDAAVRSFKPDVCLWHVGSGAAMAASLLADELPVVATVHNATCPSGARLFRDRDEICLRKSGLGCIPRWYSRQCGTDASPASAFGALKNHATVMRALKKCQRVYAVSKAVSRFLQTEGIPEGKIVVFDNTLGRQERASRTPIAPLTGIGVPLNLLFVGRLVYSKGVQYLLRAMSILHDGKMTAHLTVVGDGWYRSELDSIVDSLGITGWVKFVGNKSFSEVKAFYESADIVVVPSIYPEPAGLVVAEAREQGKRVVVTDAGGLPEWGDLMDGIYVAKAADAASIASAILSIADERVSSLVPPGYQSVGVRPADSRGVSYDRANLVEDVALFVERLENWWLRP